LNSRRKFINNSFVSLLGLSLSNSIFENKLFAKEITSHKKIKISLQCFSFASELLYGKMSILDFPRLVRNEFDLDAAEFWNIPFANKIRDNNFVKEINLRTDDNGLINTLMLVDLIDIKNGSSISLCSKDKREREIAIEKHKEWLDFSKSIGCSSIRVNLWSNNMTMDEVTKYSVESLLTLLEYSEKIDMSIVIENHGGYTADAFWLIKLIKSINHKRLGVLPDFGSNNFCVEKPAKKEGELLNTNRCINQFDKYLGVKQLLPYAKGISAKSISFDKNGVEENTDFERMIKLIKSSSFEGHIAIEYEGGFMNTLAKNSSKNLSNVAGVHATKKLIEKFI
tara:strand:+ start:583 stop:1599 length:1017 start_codon:yes stop_codon:yes gene_type:complete